jgi:uncharacterized repeat protein (TIGR03803 family)
MFSVQLLSPFGRSAASTLLILILIHCASAQTETARTKKPSATFNLLYSFTGGSDGYNPQAGVVFDSSGALYGTTFFGGTVNDSCPVGCGTVFRLAPTHDGPWSLDTIHSFTGYPSDVANSYAHVTFDKKGNLYGTAGDGGANLCSCGGIFKLSPMNGGWTESVIYNFTKHSGETPYAALILHKGVFYGSTWFGPESKGNVGNGTVFTLRQASDGLWKHNIIHVFAGGTDGYEPYSNLVFDKQDNAYGSTPYGGTNRSGDIFELIPNGRGSWTYKLIYSFLAPSSGAYPSTLALGSDGNLYGVTSGGGTTQGQDCRIYGCGMVFELQHSNTGWKEVTLYEFAGGSDGYSPEAGLIFDKQGNLYGTTMLGGTGTCQFYQYPGCGTVFELSPVGDGTWQKTTLYNFTGGDDGEFPTDGKLTSDSAGSFSGTTLGGAAYGSSGYGTVYQIVP